MSYAYQGDMLCDDCAGKVQHQLIEDSGGAHSDIVVSTDTNEYPQFASGTQADCPQHCNSCNGFLENRLTDDGYDYVREIVKTDVEKGRNDSIAVTVWAPYYDMGTENPNTNCLLAMKCPSCNSFGPFTIDAECWAVVTDDGVEGTSEHEWHDDSVCKCRQCNYGGLVSEFRKD